MVVQIEDTHFLSINEWCIFWQPRNWNRYQEFANLGYTKSRWRNIVLVRSHSMLKWSNQFSSSFAAITWLPRLWRYKSSPNLRLCISNGSHLSGNDGMFLCHRRSVHFPVGLSPDKKAWDHRAWKWRGPIVPAILFGLSWSSLLLVLGHLTDKRHRAALS